MTSDDPSTTGGRGRLVVEPDVEAAHGVGGVVWKLPHGGDLDGNLVRLAAGRSIDEHVNREVDVVVVVRAGDGELTVDGERHPLTGTTIALIPRDTRRAITAGHDGIAYLSIHRRRE
ncbi:MAG TPA: hypothetical protein VMQ81_08420, partial [Acidimicrobiia bacterium]|nr:hypothetical protein [Acidimicrobiia bacterium]